MTVTSVKSIKYLHSTAHEALDIWQLHTEDDETPHSACLGLGAHWSLSGDRTWVQGQQRQQAVTSEDTEHYDLEACYDVTQVCPIPLPPPRWPHILEWQVQLIQNGDNTTFTLCRQPTPRRVL